MNKYIIMCLFSDIDECSEDIVKIGGSGEGSATVSGSGDLWCEQRCDNTAGGYDCGCNPGYSLDDNNQTCSGSYNSNCIGIYNCHGK